MVSTRQSRLEGHRRKFLAVIDETPESARAVRYAGMRAKNSNGGLVLLYVISD
ncbi:MAG: uspA, partial [Rhizobium sp.]|nr:uspA [Rhizobium sp.]